jgi:hypothetical protein
MFSSSLMGIRRNFEEEEEKSLMCQRKLLDLFLIRFKRVMCVCEWIRMKYVCERA